jgi:hypothetical protein
MAETAKERKENKQDIRKEEVQQKPSVWQKVKKPLMTGVLAAGLLILPVKGNTLAISYAREVPIYAAELIEKEYAEGWNLLLKGWTETDRPTRFNRQAAVKYFENTHKKDRKAESLYLWAFSVYASAMTERSFEGTEQTMLNAVKLINKRLKKQPNDFEFIDLKQMIYYNLGIMYGQIIIGDSSDVAKINKNFVDFSKMGVYKERSIHYCNKWLKFYEDINEKWNELKSFIFIQGFSNEEIQAVNDSFKEGNKKREKKIKEMLKKLELR